MRSEPDVLIAGAGPTGLTLACGLLANGVAARVVDKAVGPAGTSRALGLQPRGIEVVERLGALTACLNARCRLNGSSCTSTASTRPACVSASAPHWSRDQVW